MGRGSAADEAMRRNFGTGFVIERSAAVENDPCLCRKWIYLLMQQFRTLADVHSFVSVYDTRTPTWGDVSHLALCRAVLL